MSNWESIRRTIQAWPIVAVAGVPFGLLAFQTLDLTLASFATFLVLAASVLVAEHYATD